MASRKKPAKPANYIECKLVESGDPCSKTHHVFEIDAKWSDSHHFLYMLAAITERWRDCAHEEQRAKDPGEPPLDQQKEDRQDA